MNTLKMKWRPMLALMMALVMVFGMLPNVALAEGSVTYLDSTGSEQTCESYTAITDSSTSLSSGWYYLDNDVTISDRITASGDVHLILGDGYTMTASEGITVASGNSLTIYAQSAGSGSLVATGVPQAAAIGGNYAAGGTITINGGNITATGGVCGAGIGGGNDAAGGTITINGGNITATGGNYSAGIGGGYQGGCLVTINGGSITATGGLYGAGIGSGYQGSQSFNTIISITGGNITATGGTSGAGIGGGHMYNGGTISISGGTITATGGASGAGIGGGRWSAAGNITITGGTIDATAGDDAADIGCGEGGGTIYVVTYKADGVVVDTQRVEEGRDTIVPAVPEKTGYTGAWDKDGKNITANTEINAVYTAISTGISYTVSFDRNGGFSGTMAPVTVSGEYTLPENGFQAWSTEYFRGWDVNGELKQPGEKITVTEDITIKAVWQKKDYGIIVGGVAITNENAANVLGDGKVSYDLDTKTLTLDNVNITGTTAGGAVRSALYAFNDTLIIRLVGNNKLSSFTPSDTQDASHNYAICANSLTFTGSGSLEIAAGNAETFSYGIDADTITVESECTITASAGTSGAFEYALNADTFTANGSTVLASKSNTGSPLASYYELGMGNSKYVKIQPAYNVTVSFAANSGTGTMADETVVASKEYTLPECGFTAPEGQQFKAWSVNGSEMAAGSKVYPIEDITVTAIWGTATHTVNYIADGVVVDTQSVAHGKNAVAPAVPAKEGYTGAWDHDGKNITQDTDINAVYTEIPSVTHTVTFIADGEVVGTQSVAHGEDAVLPEVPVKVGYTGEWDHDGKNITEDTTINAVYTIKFYTVKYIADGALVDTQRVAHGKNADVPTVPAKVGYSGAWDHDGKNITEDTEINAVYTAHTYTVTYKADGVVVDTQTVAYGKDAVAPEVPAKAGYTGVWDHDGKNITADLVINAVYTAIPGAVTHTVTFKADGVIISTQTVEHGKDAVLPEVPAKAGYNGAWDHDGKNITEDTVINAVYTLKNINNIPDTGDHSGMLTWAMLLVLSSLGIAATVWFNKKRIVR